MKKLIYPLPALAIALLGIAAGIPSGQSKVSKVYWRLKPGNIHLQALTATAYTQASMYCGMSDQTICGIYAEAQSNATPARPNLTTDATLHDDLVWIKSGADPQRNNSGEVYFKD